MYLLTSNEVFVCTVTYECTAFSHHLLPKRVYANTRESWLVGIEVEESISLALHRAEVWRCTVARRPRLTESSGHAERPCCPIVATYRILWLADGASRGRASTETSALILSSAA